LPEGLIGGRGAARSVAGAGTAVSVVGGAGAGAAAAMGSGTDAGAGAGAGAGAAAGATVSFVAGRDGRAGAVVLAAAGAEVSAAGAGTGAGAAAAGAAAGRLLIRRGARASPALFAGAGAVRELVTPDPVDEPDLTTVFLGAGAGSAAGGGASGWTSRRSPSASAFRRTRSAWASSMEDEWLLTPMPRERASSSPSLLLRPSSLASS
jgi:hypothetical protein